MSISDGAGQRSAVPQLNRLKREARERRFEAVVVWKLDRWGRSVADSVASIHVLLSLNIRWIAVAEDLDR